MGSRSDIGDVVGEDTEDAVGEPGGDIGKPREGKYQEGRGDVFMYSAYCLLCYTLLVVELLKVT